MRLITGLFISVLLISLPVNVHAYVGPGLGLGALGVVAGILLSVFLALLALVWYPIKRFFTKMRGKSSGKSSTNVENNG